MLFLQQSPVCKLMISMVICKITICTAHSTLNSKCEQASDVWHEPTAIVASNRKWLLSFNPTWIGCSWKLCLGMVGLSFNSEFDRGLFTNWMHSTDRALRLLHLGQSYTLDFPRRHLSPKVSTNFNPLVPGVHFKVTHT